MSEEAEAICPWCGEEVSDSPEEDFERGSVETECGYCDMPVRVLTQLVVIRRVDKIEKRKASGE